jgi:hypothetical protein
MAGFYERTRMSLTALAGVGSGDTGILVGELAQMRWSPDIPDTGQIGTLSLALVPEAGDTGSGWQFYSETLNFGAGFTRAPRQPAHGPDGSPNFLDTGHTVNVPIVGWLDRLRVKLVPTDSGVVIGGTLYTWCGR